MNEQEVEAARQYIRPYYESVHAGENISHHTIVTDTHFLCKDCGYLHCRVFYFTLFDERDLRRGNIKHIADEVQAKMKKVQEDIEKEIELLLENHKNFRRYDIRSGYFRTEFPICNTCKELIMIKKEESDE